MGLNNIKIKTITKGKLNYYDDDEKSFEKFKEQIKLYKPTFISSSGLSGDLESSILLNSVKSSSVLSNMK